MKNVKYYICPVCGNVVEMVHDTGVNPFCCGQKMTELMPNTVEASGEKHLPAVSVEGDVVTVNVGSVNHPMEEAHYIQWVALQTENGMQRRRLSAGHAPNVTFHLSGEKPVAVYAYCNLHGLWKTAL